MARSRPNYIQQRIFLATGTMPSRIPPSKKNQKINRSAGKTCEFPCFDFAVTELTKNMGVLHGNVECFR